MIQQIFLISVDDIKKRTQLDANIDDNTIKVGIMDCQELILEPAIGSALYEKILSDIASGSMTSNYQTLVTVKMWPVLYHGTVYKLGQNLLYRYTNSSVVADSNENSTAIEKENLNALRSEREIAMRHHIRKLTLYLQDNIDKFPEYVDVDADGLPAEPIVNGMTFFYDGDYNY